VGKKYRLPLCPRCYERRRNAKRRSYFPKPELSTSQKARKACEIWGLSWNPRPFPRKKKSRKRTERNGGIPVRHLTLFQLIQFLGED